AQIFQYLQLDPAEQRRRYRSNLATAAAANPSDPKLKVQLGALLLNDGKVEEALAAFREALTLSPDAQVLKEGADALMEHKQYALARELLGRVVEADPSVDNWLDFALAVFHTAGAHASLAEIDKIPAGQRNGDVYLLKAQVLEATGQFEDAADALNAGF